MARSGNIYIDLSGTYMSNGIAPRGPYVTNTLPIWFMMVWCGREPE